MKTRTVLVVFFLGAAVFLLVWMLQVPRGELQKLESDAATKSPNVKSDGYGVAEQRPPTAPRDREAPTYDDEQRTWALGPLPPGANVQGQLEELARSRGVSLEVLTQQMLIEATNLVQEMAQAANRPIEFYGRAVDEQGLAIERARVEFTCIAYPESQLQTNVLTDANGLFGFNNATGIVLVVRVSTDAYEEVPGTNQNRFEYYSIPSFEPPFRADPNTPVVFRLRKKTN